MCYINQYKTVIIRYSYFLYFYSVKIKFAKYLWLLLLVYLTILVPTGKSFMNQRDVLGKSFHELCEPTFFPLPFSVEIDGAIYSLHTISHWHTKRLGPVVCHEMAWDFEFATIFDCLPPRLYDNFNMALVHLLSFLCLPSNNILLLQGIYNIFWPLTFDPIWQPVVTLVWYVRRKVSKEGVTHNDIIW